MWSRSRNQFTGGRGTGPIRNFYQAHAASILNVVLVACIVWLRLLSPGFELVTNAGEAAGREVLARFEQLRRVFRGAEAVLPVRVYLFRSERDMKPFRPAESTKGFYQSSPERDIIVIQEIGAETMRAAFHEYVHLVLNHASTRLPRWFEEGTAEFYSTLESESERLRIGRPVEAHLRTLARTPWLDAGTFFSVDRKSPYYNDSSKVGIFYAQSWALVHMLNLAPEYRAGMPRFADGATFLEAFGKTRDDALRDLRRYLGAGSLPVADVAGADGGNATALQMHELDETAASLLKAELLLAVGKDKEAAKAYLKLPQERPDVQTALGILALGRRDHAEAGQRLKRALELGSRQASTYFEYAMLLRETGGSRDEVLKNLRKTVQLDPNYAEAHFLLSLLGPAEEKIEHLNRAVAILPRQSNFWHALAMAQHDLGHTEAARRAAARALENATTEQETTMAQAALRLAGQTKEARGPKKPDVVVPPSWNEPKGDARVEGVLRRIDCFSQGARMFLEAGGRHVSVYIANPGEVLLRDASSVTFEFACGVQKPRNVSVEYVTRPDARLGTAGDVVSIQFR